MTLIIYHNPRCSTSRKTLDILKKEKADFRVVEYLKHPLSAAELKDLLQKLRMNPAQLVRKKEPLYKEKYAGRVLSDDEWLRVLSANPVLIERPVVVKGSRAVLGRPPENVCILLEGGI